jgi:hypothetical protein
MAGQIPARQLGQSAVTAHRPGLAKPIANQRKGVLSTDHRPPHHKTTQASEHQQIHGRLAFCAHSRRGDPLAQRLKPRGEVVMVTSEPLGGSFHPTSSPVLRVVLHV